MGAIETNTAQNIRMDYMKLLITQLQNQNPLEPLDNHDMAMQLTQFSQLEQLENMSSSFQRVLQATDRSHAASLLGKKVTFLAPGTGEDSGRVDGVEIIMGEARLRIGGTVVYTVDDEPATTETRVNELDQTKYLQPTDNIILYGVKSNGEQLGGGQGITIALRDGDQYITLDRLLATITDAFRINGQKTYYANLVDGEIRLTDEAGDYAQTNMALYYDGSGSFDLPRDAVYLPSLADVTSITD